MVKDAPFAGPEGGHSFGESPRDEGTRPERSSDQRSQGQHSSGQRSRDQRTRGQRSSGSEAAEAVWAARAVQPTWAARPLEERLRPIAALRAHLGERPGEALAALGLGPGVEEAAARGEALSAQVVPLADACAFLQRSAEDLLAPRRPEGEGRPGWLAGVELEVVREPLGVVLVIAPSNYPLFLPGVQVIQALAAGKEVTTTSPANNQTKT